MRPIYIYLDDLRDAPSPEYKVIRSYDEFVDYFMSVGNMTRMHIVSFDHDLGLGKNGYDCAKWLAKWCDENDYELPGYCVHSANPVGRKNIESVFETYKKTHDEYR